MGLGRVRQFEAAKGDGRTKYPGRPLEARQKGRRAIGAVK